MEVQAKAPPWSAPYPTPLLAVRWIQAEGGEILMPAPGPNHDPRRAHPLSLDGLGKTQMRSIRKRERRNAGG